MAIQRITTDTTQPQKPQQRTDKFNNAISKANKSYKVSFRDEVVPSSEVADTYVVQNWKSYNVIEEPDGSDECACSVS